MKYNLLEQFVLVILITFFSIFFFEFWLYPSEKLSCDSQYNCEISHKYYKLIPVKQKFKLSPESAIEYKYIYNRKHIFSGENVINVSIKTPSKKYFVTLHSDSKIDLESKLFKDMELFYNYLDKPYDSFEIKFDTPLKS